MEGYLIGLARSRSEDQEIVKAAQRALTWWGGSEERNLWMTEEVDNLFFSYPIFRVTVQPSESRCVIHWLRKCGIPYDRQQSSMI